MRKTKDGEKTAVKQAAVKGETPASPAAKPVKTARKSAAKAGAKAAAKPVELVTVQFQGQEWDAAALLARAREAYAAQGAAAGEIARLALYIKPEEGMAYYVVNETETGSIAL